MDFDGPKWYYCPKCEEDVTPGEDLGFLVCPHCKSHVWTRVLEDKDFEE